MPPTCLHGTKKFKMGRNAKGLPWAGYFCPSPFTYGNTSLGCVPTWDAEITRRSDMTFNKLPNGRLYNPGTGQYELVDPPKPADPWAGAPAGIRVHQAPILDGATHRVLTEEGTHRLNGPDAGFRQFFTRTGEKMGLQEAVVAYRRCWWTFPDFDDAPIGGLRFFYKHPADANWSPAIIGDELAAFGHTDHPWCKSDRGEHKHLSWWRKKYAVIMVGEEPKPKPTKVGSITCPTIKPVVETDRFHYNAWKAERPNILPGDVIRDTATGATWFLEPGTAAKAGTWKQVGMSSLHAPAVIDRDKFQAPDHYKILSRAVAQ